MSENSQANVGSLANAIAALDTRKGELEDELKSIKARRDQAEKTLIEAMSAQNIDSVKASGRTVYLQRTIWPKSIGGDELIAKLKKHRDTRFLVSEKTHAQQLAAWVRELPRDADDMPKIPKRLNGLLEVSEKFAIRSRKA